MNVPLSRLRLPGVIAATILVGSVTLLRSHQEPTSATKRTAITDVAGIRVGHQTLTTRPTGCTVVLVDGNATGAVDVRGGAPGTRETDLLAPDNTVQTVNAIVLAGGSAFGLDAASGVMQFLSERKIGYQTSGGPVPIVPAAIIFDLNVGDRPDVRPDAACGYAAAQNATGGAIDEGSVGAGAGATLGKTMGRARAMKGGLGTASVTTTDGLVVGAIVVVNAVGSVVDPRTGRAVAGVRTADGRGLEDPFALVLRGVAPSAPARENTTIGVVATNARLTKAEALKVVEMAHDGLARSIVPSHMPSDGDALFALATGRIDATPNVGNIGAIAAEVVAQAVLRAARSAKGLPGFPAASDIR